MHRNVLPSGGNRFVWEWDKQSAHKNTRLGAVIAHRRADLEHRGSLTTG